jgi:SsrA-binding protein
MVKSVAQNRRARFDYEISDTLEAGIVLTGQEVKSCRVGHVDLRGAYVSFTGGKAVLKGMKIMKYQFASQLEGYEPAHDRPLLLKKAEVEKLASLANEKGGSIIALEVKVGKYIKVVLGIAKGRKTVDKRARIKERDIERRLKKGEDI